MSPTVHEVALHLPAGWHLEPQQVCQPHGADPRPLLTDDAGHVLAVVERVPDEPS